MRQYHNQPAESPLHKSLVAMWDAVKTETHGRVEVQTFADNNHAEGGDPAVLKMLIAGDLEFFTLNGGLIGAVVPAVNVQGIPFAFQTLDQVFSAMDGDLGDYLREEMRAKGIYALPKGAFDNGFQQLSITNKPVRTVADMQGVKIRTPNTALYIEAFQALGATPVPINIDKLYDALKAHEVDAQTNPLTIIELFKLYEIQKYVSLTSHLWAGLQPDGQPESVGEVAGGHSRSDRAQCREIREDAAAGKCRYEQQLAGEADRARDDVHGSR